MTTIYAACLQRLGLSQAEASRLHNVRLDTVKSWCHGRNRPPAAVFDELRALEAQIIDRAEQLREKWEAAGAAASIHIDASEADHLTLMADADFVLGLEGVEITDGATEATIAARRMRRMAG